LLPLYGRAIDPFVPVEATNGYDTVAAEDCSAAAMAAARQSLSCAGAMAQFAR
jgi:hypothetical protein